MWGFSGDAVVKNPPANAGDMGSITRSERSLEEEMAAHSSILAWEIQWTEEPVNPWGHKESDTTECMCVHTHTHTHTRHTGHKA